MDVTQGSSLRPELVVPGPPCLMVCVCACACEYLQVGQVSGESCVDTRLYVSESGAESLCVLYVSDRSLSTSCAHVCAPVFASVPRPVSECVGICVASVDILFLGRNAVFPPRSETTSPLQKAWTWGGVGAGRQLFGSLSCPPPTPLTGGSVHLQHRQLS